MLGESDGLEIIYAGGSRLVFSILPSPMIGGVHNFVCMVLRAVLSALERAPLLGNILHQIIKRSRKKKFESDDFKRRKRMRMKRGAPLPARD